MLASGENNARIGDPLQFAAGIFNASVEGSYHPLPNVVYINTGHGEFQDLWAEAQLGYERFRCTVRERCKADAQNAKKSKDFFLMFFGDLSGYRLDQGVEGLFRHRTAFLDAAFLERPIKDDAARPARAWSAALLPGGQGRSRWPARHRLPRSTTILRCHSMR